MTDFFGGVASVEVMGLDGALPLLGRTPAEWEEVGRAKMIRSGRAERDWRTHPSSSAAAFGAGWERPLSMEGAWMAYAERLFWCFW